GRRAPQTVQRTDQGGLAGTGEAHHDEDLAFIDLERSVDDGSGHQTRLGNLASGGLITYPIDGLGRPATEDLIDIFVALDAHTHLSIRPARLGRRLRGGGRSSNRR